MLEVDMIHRYQSQSLFWPLVIFSVKWLSNE